MEKNTKQSRASPIEFESMTDSALLKLYQLEKNNDAIDCLWSRYTHLLFGVALNYLRDVDDAKDAVQHAAVQLLTTKKAIEEPKNWLFTIVKNFCLSSIKYTDNKQVIDEANDYMNKEELQFVQNDVINTLIVTEQNERLNAAIQTLVTAQRVCINLFYLEKNSVKQIAKLTEYTPEAIRSHLQNGKLNLRKKLGNE